MKIRINQQGILEIERAGKWKEQYCPRQQERVPCGDWCPLFGKPKTVRYFRNNKPIEEKMLTICNRGVFYCDLKDFEDLRNQEKEE